MFLLPLGYMPSLVWCIENLFHTHSCWCTWCVLNVVNGRLERSDVCKNIKTFITLCTIPQCKTNWALRFSERKCRSKLFSLFFSDL